MLMMLPAVLCLRGGNEVTGEITLLYTRYRKIDRVRVYSTDSILQRTGKMY